MVVTLWPTQSPKIKLIIYDCHYIQSTNSELMDQFWCVRVVHVQFQSPCVDVSINVSTCQKAASIANVATGQVTDGAHMLSSWWWKINWNFRYIYVSLLPVSINNLTSVSRINQESVEQYDLLNIKWNLKLISFYIYLEYLSSMQSNCYEGTSQGCYSLYHRTCNLQRNLNNCSVT